MATIRRQTPPRAEAFREQHRVFHKKPVVCQPVLGNFYGDLGFPDCQGPLDPPQPPYLGQTDRNSCLMCANSNFPILRQCAMLNLYFAAKIHISHFVKNKTLEHDMY